MVHSKHSARVMLSRLTLTQGKGLNASSFSGCGAQSTGGPSLFSTSITSSSPISGAVSRTQSPRLPSSLCTSSSSSSSSCRSSTSFTSPFTRSSTSSASCSLSCSSSSSSVARTPLPSSKCAPLRAHSSLNGPSTRQQAGSVRSRIGCESEKSVGRKYCTRATDATSSRALCYGALAAARMLHRLSVGKAGSFFWVQDDDGT
ncbi:hypothetical protein CBR_g31133 [Chara braunii]|uniref:Uncharacterized protein n=1 Tax=Chara braunii TaxID=69332 RepID=A0A388LEE7_CHABU|nr:hypothetical protein CBR_g31133 [Chara braunii]|eukprot:GBG80674.1 hypothetical protein CBR_g31133 [Chara braunii]